MPVFTHGPSVQFSWIFCSILTNNGFFYNLHFTKKIHVIFMIVYNASTSVFPYGKCSGYASVGTASTLTSDNWKNFP